jgi:hypothetical protein
VISDEVDDGTGPEASSHNIDDGRCPWFDHVFPSRHKFPCSMDPRLVKVFGVLSLAVACLHVMDSKLDPSRERAVVGWVVDCRRQVQVRGIN